MLGVTTTQYSYQVVGCLTAVLYNGMEHDLICSTPAMMLMAIYFWI
jgi:hypothetical protein